jgi:large subunit ribosomal protein L32e
LCRDLRER